MAGPLAIGTPVRVLAPWSGDEENPSEVTTIAAVQYVTSQGEIVDEPQPEWQYRQTARRRLADIAFRPEYIEVA
jgi:hypothetical protein